jgi:hypothetical protein
MATHVEVIGFPGYRVSDDGVVSSSRGPTGAWLPLRPQGRRGYPRVGLWRDGKLHWRSVHTLVLTAFVGPRPDGQEACHRDNDRTNNALANLRWDTPKGNHADSDHKRRRGSAHAGAKLSESDIPEIRRRVEAGETRRAVARSFEVSHTVVNAIVRGTAWKHAP